VNGDTSTYFLLISPTAKAAEHLVVKVTGRMASRIMSGITRTGGLMDPVEQD
jgi:hypothetical protein